MKKVLVVGALGTVGRAAVAHFESQHGWEVLGLSRRPPDFPTKAKFISADLQEAASLRSIAGDLAGVTHVVYAALHEQPNIVSGWTEGDHVRVNLLMLNNLLNAVEEASTSFTHISLMQGGKAYGLHLGPPPLVPSRESDPRTMPPNFYFDQEDLMRTRQRNAAWSWTIFRPPSVCGFAVGSPMNAILAVGVFASLCREMGLPFRFPGALGHLKDACDAGLLARAIAWAGQADTARNEIFNVANGDCFMWEQLWPHVAEVFNMEHAFPHALSLARAMPDKGHVWDAIVKKHDLKPYRLDQLVPNWQFADFTFRYGQKPYESLMSTIKLRQAGFHECADTQTMTVNQLRELQAARILPH
ncbi:MAG: dependent epimerase/dehydratase family protein [Hyphomicrobiales bacterium]|nr:dependent epimerase/dehydratase family protein [Hyphomicrobiales bacterium]